MHRSSSARDRSIKVLIADDEYDVRALLALALEDEPRLEVVGTAEDAPQAVELAERERPDAALVDANMPGGGGLHAIKQIRERSPHTALVVLSAFDERQLVVELLEAGAVTYLVKPADREELARTLVQSVEAHRALA